MNKKAGELLSYFTPGPGTPGSAPINMDWSAYGTVYLGTPNWWSTMAPPVASFLHEVMPTDKVIVPLLETISAKTCEKLDKIRRI